MKHFLDKSTWIFNIRRVFVSSHYFLTPNKQAFWRNTLLEVYYKFYSYINFSENIADGLIQIHLSPFAKYNFEKMTKQGLM